MIADKEKASTVSVLDQQKGYPDGVDRGRSLCQCAVCLGWHMPEGSSGCIFWFKHDIF